MNIQEDISKILFKIDELKVECINTQINDLNVNPYLAEDMIEILRYLKLIKALTLKIQYDRDHDE